MRNIKDFQARYDRWKNGERYWDIRGVDLPRYDTGNKNTVVTDDGSVFNVDPSAIGAHNLEVTTPEIEVISQKPFYLKKREQLLNNTTYNPGEIRQGKNPSVLDKVRTLLSDYRDNAIARNVEQSIEDWQHHKTPIQVAFDNFAYMNPYTATIAAGSNLLSDHGIKRTVNLAKNGQYGSAALSGLGDLFDASMLTYGGRHIKNNGVFDTAKLFRNTRFGNYLQNKIISNQLNGNIKNWDGTVGMEYFNSPNNWYRWTETPEIEGIKEVGKNVTTRDAVYINIPSNNWRTAAMDNYSKSKEGYWYKADKPDEDMPLREWLNYLKNNANKPIGSGKKYGSAHGNKSQAAYGKAWDGSLSTSGIGQLGLLEGQAGIQIPFGKTRTSFTLTPIEEVPIGGRIGFSTGEMPLDNLGWFTKLPNGRFRYNGEVLPYKRIELPQKQGNSRYQFDSPTYQVYTGPKHDISEIINADGSVNLRNLLNVQNDALRNIPGGTIARHRLENQKWHPTDWNTFLHTRDVYKRALQYGYPEEALFPALMHDFGKMWAGDGHGPYGASIIQQIFPKASKEQIQAIYGHMDKNPINPLTKLVKGVDIKETNPFRTEWIMRKMEDQGIKDNFDVVPFFDDVYELNPIKGSPFDNYNNYIYKRLNRNPEYGYIYIQPGKDLNLAGSFNHITENSRIYHSDNDQLNTAVHEAISHKTDNLVENELTSKFIPKTDVNYINVPTSTYYTDLADVDGNSWFRSGTYEDWREMRATLNELRSMRRNINNMSDSELLDNLSYVNGYGQKYTKLLRQLDDSARKKWFSKFRTAYKYLPVSIPLISPLNKDNSYEKER